MKKSLLLLLPVLFVGCLWPQPRNVITVAVAYPPGKITIVGCEPVVQYSGRSFKTSGVEIPIPQLGGAAKVGDVSYTPQTLNTLYRNVAILDALRLQYCGDRVAMAQVGPEAFRACNERIQTQEEKIAALAIAATEGEAAVEKALHEVTTASAGAAPATADAKKLDSDAVKGLKETAAATSGGAPAASSAPIASPAPTLPPQVASVVNNTDTSKLLTLARSKPPEVKPAASPKP